MVFGARNTTYLGYGSIPKPRVSPPRGDSYHEYGPPTVEWILAEFDAFKKDALDPEKEFVDKLRTKNIIEKVETLSGTLNRQSVPNSAVRYRDMRHIADLPSIPKARKATGSTVSVEQYNRLVDDMNLLYQCLGSLASIISKKGV